MIVQIALRYSPENEIKMRESVIQLAFGIALMVGTAILTVLFSQHQLDSTTSSWIQGVGTVGAILAAIWAGNLPFRIEKQKQIQLKAELIYSLDRAVKILDEPTQIIIDLFYRKQKHSVDMKGFLYGASWAITPLDRLLDRPNDWPSDTLYSLATRLSAEAHHLHSSVTPWIKSTTPGEETMNLGQSMSQYATALRAYLECRHPSDS